MRAETGRGGTTHLLRAAETPAVSTARAVGPTKDSRSPMETPAPPAPEPFAIAVTSLGHTQLRPEATVEVMRAPTRLAPWAHALGAQLNGPDGAELASGKLVLLYDPDGAEAWDGEFRLVAFATVEMDDAIGVDPLLPAVGWSWLIEALEQRAAGYVSLGGTVTQTTSTRFGDIHGPTTTVSLELRGSWTATEPNLEPHLLAFVDLLSAAAGLPPEGVSVLSTG